MGQEQVYDVAIIGGGPAGLTAAVYSARAKLKTLVLDKSPSAGAMGMARRIESFPGQLHVTSGPELLSVFRKQAQKFGAETVQDEVVGVDLQSKPKRISTLGGEYHVKAVIAATGSMGRKPSIEGEAALVGRGVGYCAACDAAFFDGRDVAMVGDLDRAMEEFDQVARFARKIYLVTVAGDIEEQHRRHLQANIDKVEVLHGYRLAQIIGKDSVEKIEIQGLDGKKSLLDVSGVFLYLFGRLPIVDFLQGSLTLDPDGCILVNRDDMSTSIEGVYAIGDVTCRRFRQAVLAAADGCLAALAVERYLSGTGK